jgi:hypothetical protein
VEIQECDNVWLAEMMKTQNMGFFSTQIILLSAPRLILLF